MTDVHQEIRSLLAAYVMDAVPPEEVPAIRAHILSCEECFQEADSYAESLTVLAESVPPSPVPAGFADRVMQAAVGDEVETRVKASRVPWFRRYGMRAAVALALVAVAVTSVSLVTSIQRQREYERIVASLVRDDGALRLSGPGGAAAVVASTDGGTTLVATNLGEAPKGRDYQLWLMKEGVPTPSETFDSTGSVVIVEADQSLDRFDGAAITVEPEGGSSQPTTDPVLSS